MAEVFGVVAAALSVAALFNNVVDCFEYVQLGRNFAIDNQTCQLRLDIARLRLSRWGAAVDINNDARFAHIDPADGQVRTAKHTLEQILNLFGRTYNESSALKLAARPDDLPLFDPASNTNQTGCCSPKLDARACTLAPETDKPLQEDYHQAEVPHPPDRRHPGASRRPGEHLPKQEAYKRMVEVEVEEIGDIPRLQVLSEAAQDDTLLRDAAREKVQRLSGNTVDKASVADNARVRAQTASPHYVLLPVRGWILCQRKCRSGVKPPDGHRRGHQYPGPVLPSSCLET